MRYRRIAWVAGVVSLVVAGLSAAPVDAEVIKLDPIEGTDSFDYSDCGYPVHAESVFEGRASLRVGKNRNESVFFIRENVTFREVHTNTLTDEWFVVRGQFSFHERKATHVEGNIYELTLQQSGQPFVIEDSSGQVVAKDRGVVRFRILFDTGGDDDPSGEFVELLEVEVHGPHPATTNFCSFVGDLVGISDSSQRYTLRPEGTTASPLGYAEYLPPDYGDEGTSPLLVFLHGFGESGDGSEEQLAFLGAIPGYIANDGWPDDRPFVVLAPQHEVSGDLTPYDCDTPSCGMFIQHDLGHPNPGSICMTPDEVDAFVSYAIAAYDVDPQRVYLTGLSCGAFGAWEYLAEHGSDQVAAVVPIAGEGRPAWDTAGCSLGEVPLWAFHGEADDVVDPAGSIEPITQLQACTSPPPVDARLTTYPDVGHDSWTMTYAVGAEHDIYTWMLGKSHP
jgi:predicted esterase